MPEAMLGSGPQGPREAAAGGRTPCSAAGMERDAGGPAARLGTGAGNDS